MATIRIGMAHKANLGDYSNFTFDVMVEDESRPNETVTAAYDRIYKFVEERVGREIAKIDKVRGS